MEPKEIKRRTKSPEQALAALMRLCARAEKSSGDARRLMRGWGVAPADAERVLAKLRSDRFIDDRRYAAAFVREKSALNGWGVYKIRAALQRKEVDRALIDEALAALDPQGSREQLRGRLERKLRTLKGGTPYERRTKLMRYGLSLGYDFEQVGDLVTQLLQSQDERCDTFFD